jgi:two-component system cell cycle response regulator
MEFANMPGRILVADSSVNNRISLNATLTSEYFEAICVTDAKSVSQAVLKFQPDVILMAVNLGPDDGYAVCKKLKLNPFSAHIPVVLYASKVEQVDWSNALLNLVDDVHLYPQDKATLISRLRLLYRQKVELDSLKTHANAADQFGFNDITVEFPSGRLIKSKVALINHRTQTTAFNLDPIVGGSYPLSFDCKPSDVNPNTDLIILQNADAQCRLLSDFQESANTKNIPVMSLVDRPANAQVKRLYELGSQECLLSTSPPSQINARAQSLIAVNQHKSKLRGLLNERVKQACFDPLTNLYNRRHAQQYLSKYFQQAQKGDNSLVALMLDIDKFKSVNDTLGHIGGDAILKQIAERLSENVRRVDMVARVGGEEFLILIPNASMKRALEIAERLRLLVEEKPFEVNASKLQQNITVSIGIAKRSKRHKYASDLINCADQALYKAKEKGRNCVYVAAA